MNEFERLMSLFPNLEYKFEKNMPSKQKGLYLDDIVYLNTNLSAAELTSTVAEEIAHHYTSVSDITNYKLNEKLD